MWALKDRRDRCLRAHQQAQYAERLMEVKRSEGNHEHKDQEQQRNHVGLGLKCGTLTRSLYRLT